MEISGFTFVVTHIDVIGTLPVELAGGHIFRPANDEEVKSIESQLSNLSIYTFSREILSQGDFGIPYRFKITEQREGNCTKFHKEELARDKWKYWGIAFNGNNGLIHDLQLASILIPTDIDFGTTTLFSELNQQGKSMGVISMPYNAVTQYFDPRSSNENAKIMDVSELYLIHDLHVQIKHLPEEGSFVRLALNSYYNLRSLPAASPLIVLGYFAIIESIVTHAPRSNETLDSINHQIVNKMTLLNKRFSRCIALKDFFYEASEETTWKQLYAYRSCVAHGGIPEFTSKFRILKSHAAVSLFLKEIIKELIIYGLREYIFLSDLKKC